MKLSVQTALLLTALVGVGVYLFTTGKLSLKVKKKETTTEEVLEEEVENMLLAGASELDKITTGRGNFAELN